MRSNAAHPHRVPRLSRGGSCSLWADVRGALTRRSCAAPASTRTGPAQVSAEDDGAGRGVAARSPVPLYTRPLGRPLPDRRHPSVTSVTAQVCGPPPISADSPACVRVGGRTLPWGGSAGCWLPGCPHERVTPGVGSCRTRRGCDRRPPGCGSSTRTRGTPPRPGGRRTSHERSAAPPRPPRAPGTPRRPARGP